MKTLRTLHYEEVGLHGKLVAFVTLARPQAGNRIDVRMIQDLAAVCDHLEDESEADVVVFRAQGPDFCAGIDFGAFNPHQPIDIHGFNKWEKIAVRLERLPKVTVALVDGLAAGGGFQLVLVADQRIATPGASFQLPEVHMGFLPGMATFRLAKIIGLGHAKRLMLCAERVGAQRALELGILDAVDPDLDAALGRTIASFGPIHNVAVQLCRRLLNESFAADFENAIGHFLAAQHRAVTQTAFLKTLQREHQD
jgi:enoyl-CoA hydratase/carnithine racemase